jgi:hypothetical protein
MPKEAGAQCPKSTLKIAFNFSLLTLKAAGRRLWCGIETEGI